MNKKIRFVVPTYHHYYYFTERWLKFRYVSMSLNNLCWFAVADPGDGPAPPRLFLDQTEARRAETFFWRPGRPPLSKGLDDRPLFLSQGLDPALV